MKILQVITLSELGGAQSVVSNLSNSLCNDHEIIVVAGEGDGKMWALLDKRVVQEYCPFLRRSLSLRFDFLTVLFLFKLYRKYKPDIIHLHSSKAGILGRFAFPSKKIVYTVHGFDSIRIAYRKFLPIERYMQRWCEAIVAVSKYDLEMLKSEGITKHVSVVHNGICRPEISTPISFPFLTKSKKVILVVARISPQKKHDLFMEVARLLPNYIFVWIGNQITILDNPENVFFLGNLPNAGAYCSLVDLFMLPSNYEGLPMVILEAMSFGKPIVASNVGGIKEIVKDGVNGFTIDNMPELFAEKITYILENENVYKMFSLNSLERFNKDLTLQNMKSSYLKIYLRLLNGSDGIL